MENKIFKGAVEYNPDPSKMYKELEQLDKQIERVRKHERDN